MFLVFLFFLPLFLSSLPLDCCHILLNSVYLLEWVKCFSGFALSLTLSRASQVIFPPESWSLSPSLLTPHPRPPSPVSHTHPIQLVGKQFPEHFPL